MELGFPSDAISWYTTFAMETVFLTKSETFFDFLETKFCFGKEYCLFSQINPLFESFYDGQFYNYLINSAESKEANFRSLENVSAILSSSCVFV